MENYSHYIYYRGGRDPKRTIPPILSCPKKYDPYVVQNPSMTPEIRPAMTRPAFKRMIKPGGSITTTFSSGSATGGNVQGYKATTSAPLALVASFDTMSGTDISGGKFISTGQPTTTTYVDSGGTTTGTASITTGEFGDITAIDNILGGSDFLSFSNLYISSKQDPNASENGFISLWNNYYIGAEKKLMDYTTSYLLQTNMTSTTIRNMMTEKITDIVAQNFNQYMGSKFTSFGSGTIDGLTPKGLYWTPTGSYQNTLTIYGNLRVEKGTATVKVTRLITSNPTYGINIHNPGEYIITTGDIGIEMAWNTTLIDKFTISSITSYSGTKALIITTQANNYIVGDEVYIVGTNSEPSINGIWVIIDTPDIYSFTINKIITTAGTAGTVSISFELAFLGFDINNHNLKYYSIVTNKTGGIYTGNDFGDMQIGSLILDGGYLTIGKNSPYAILDTTTNDLVFENNKSAKSIILRATSTSSVTPQNIVSMNGATGDLNIKDLNLNQTYTISSNSINVNDIDLTLLNNTDNVKINVTNSSIEKTAIYFHGYTGNIGINQLTTPNVDFDVNGSVSIPSATQYVYLGGLPTANNTWRLYNNTSTGRMTIQKRISGTWRTLETIGE